MCVCGKCVYVTVVGGVYILGVHATLQGYTGYIGSHIFHVHKIHNILHKTRHGANRPAQRRYLE